jgi:hypothetical protein
MSQSNAIASENAPEERLPRRDWVLLPLVSLLTIGLILGSAEWIARRMFTESLVGADRCHTFRDPVSGVERISNCVYWGKDLETQPTEYRFNSSGYRSDAEFGPKSPGTYRIALVGSSFGLGAGTQNEQTFAVTLPADLSRRTGHAVELYNEAIPGIPGLPQSLTRRFQDVLTTQPNLVLWELTEWDIKEAMTPLPVSVAPVKEQSLQEKAWIQLRKDLPRHEARQVVSDFLGLARGVSVSAKDFLGDARTTSMLLHYFYKSQSIYVKNSLRGPDEFVGYLRAEPSAEWQARLRAFDADVASVEAQAKEAGVTLAVVLLPSHTQAEMISLGEWPAGYDPYKLDNDVRLTVMSRGAVYIDIFPGFRDIPNVGRYYLPVDGHPNAGGQAVISRLLADRLSTGAVPALGATALPRAVAQTR